MDSIVAGGSLMPGEGPLDVYGILLCFFFILHLAAAAVVGIRLLRLPQDRISYFSSTFYLAFTPFFCCVLMAGIRFADLLHGRDLDDLREISNLDAILFPLRYIILYGVLLSAVAVWIYTNHYFAVRRSLGDCQPASPL